jgi:hypothetical protein
MLIRGRIKAHERNPVDKRKEDVKAVGKRKESLRKHDTQIKLWKIAKRQGQLFSFII